MYFSVDQCEKSVHLLCLSVVKGKKGKKETLTGNVDLGLFVLACVLLNICVYLGYQHYGQIKLLSAQFQLTGSPLQADRYASLPVDSGTDSRLSSLQCLYI